MRTGKWLIGGVATLAAAGTAIATVRMPDPIARQRAQLRDAKLESQRAQARADRLDRQAAAAGDAARRATAQRAAIEARITAAEADIDAGEARVALVAQALAAERDRLAERQGVVVRLVAALQSLASRPSILSVAQPGSTSDIVHVRAVLGTVTPIIAQRSADVRRELARTRRLREDAGRALAALRDSRDQLDRQRIALVQLEATERLQSRRLARDARLESDRALALAEQARELVEAIEEEGSAADVAAALQTLPGPLPRPDPAAAPAGRTAGAPYRLPVRGELVAGLGAPLPSGVRSRGLMIAAPPGSMVRAPAAGRVAFARAYRGYGQIVILDHGDGWTTLVTGLGELTVAPGESVAQGVAIGRAPRGGAPRIGLELRRNGVAMDAAALMG